MPDRQDDSGQRIAACQYLGDRLAELPQAHDFDYGIADIRPVKVSRDDRAAPVAKLEGRLYNDLQTRSSSLEAALEIAAEASRLHPNLRFEFGQRSAAGRIWDNGCAASHRCVLDVAALSIVDPFWNKNDNVRRSALRIIANVCVDNNVNRSYLLWKGTIGALKLLALQKRCVDLLVPALYNVCAGYGILAKNEEGQDLTDLTVTELELGSMLTHNGDAAIKGVPALQALLDLREDVPTTHLSLLAKLGDMASKVPARLIITGAIDDETTDDIRSFFMDLCNAVEYICAAEKACRGIMVQTALRVASGQLELLARSPWVLLTLRSVLQNAIDGVEDSYQLQEAFMRMIYDVSAHPQVFGDLFFRNRAVYRMLLTELEQVDPVPAPAHSYRLAAALVLMANGSNSSIRMMETLSRCKSLPDKISQIYDANTDAAILLPAIELAARVADNPQGQISLRDAHMLDHISARLGRATSDARAHPPSVPSTPSCATTTHVQAVQRGSISLARLLLKATWPPKPQKLAHPSVLATLTTAITALAATSRSATIRFEAGLFCVELLRHVSSPESQFPRAPSATAEPAVTSLPVPQSTLLAPVLALTLDSTSQLTRAAGVFGLSLLLSMRAELAEEERMIEGLINSRTKLMKVFRDGIVDPFLQRSNGGNGTGVGVASNPSQRRTEEDELANVNVVVARSLEMLRTDQMTGDLDLAGADELREALVELAAELGVRFTSTTHMPTFVQGWSDAARPALKWPGFSSAHST
jgi:hypothetical protein